MYVGTECNSAPRNSYLADFAARADRLKQNPEGVVSAGELAPPSEKRRARFHLSVMLKVTPS